MTVRRWRVTAAALGCVLVAAACAAPDDGAELADPTATSSASEAQASASTAAAAGEADAAPSGAIDWRRGRVEPDPAPVVGRTDVAVTGNRVVEASSDLAAIEAVVAELPAAPAWVIPWPDPTADVQQWLVTLVDGRELLVEEAEVSSSGTVAQVGDEPVPVDALWNDGRVFVEPAYRGGEMAIDALDDARLVTDGEIEVTLVGPTDRYAHGVLGDAIEASAIEILDLESQKRTRIEIDAPAVIEGNSPMLADVDGDGATDVVVTRSDPTDGARLEVYRVDGSLLASSAPIGRPNRWRNQLAVAPTGPNGEIELIDVRTPHLGGTVQFFQLDGDELVLAANSSSDFTSHVFGSRNLDMGIVADGTGDGRPDVIVPRQDRRAFAVIARTEAGVDVTLFELPAEITTNIAAAATDGGLAVAMGTSDGRLLVWSP